MRLRHSGICEDHSMEKPMLSIPDKSIPARISRKRTIAIVSWPWLELWKGSQRFLLVLPVWHISARITWNPLRRNSEHHERAATQKRQLLNTITRRLHDWQHHSEIVRQRGRSARSRTLIWCRCFIMALIYPMRLPLPLHGTSLRTDQAFRERLAPDSERWDWCLAR